MVPRDIVVFSVIIAQIALSIFCRLLARSKNADEHNAFFAGLLFGIIAMLYYVGIPKRDVQAPKKGLRNAIALGCGFVIWLNVYGIALDAILRYIGI